MGYQHTLAATVEFKDGVTPDQIATAMEPVFRYFGYDGAKVLAGTETLYRDHNIIWTGEAQVLDLYTCGDVSGQFSDLVAAAAENIGPLTAQPGSFELRNYDTADLDNAISEYEYGESEETISAWARKGDCESALDLLAKHIDPASMAKIKEIVMPAMVKTIGSVCFIGKHRLLHEVPLYEDEDPAGAVVLERAKQAVESIYTPFVEHVTPSMLDAAQRVVREFVSDDEQLEQAKALGFDSIEDMRQHEAWLRRNGGAPYHQWLTELLRTNATDHPS